MGTLLYRDYALTTEATHDQTSGQYTPVVRIAWRVDGNRDTHSFLLPKPCSTLDEANSVGLEVAKAWVDRRHIPLHPDMADGAHVAGSSGGPVLMPKTLSAYPQLVEAHQSGDGDSGDIPCSGKKTDLCE